MIVDGTVISDDCTDIDPWYLSLELAAGEGTSFTISGTVVFAVWGPVDGVLEIVAVQASCTNDDYTFACEPAAMDNAEVGGTLALAGEVTPGLESLTITMAANLTGAACTIVGELLGVPSQ